MHIHCQTCGTELATLERFSKYRSIGYCNRQCHRAEHRDQPRNTPSDLLAEPADETEEAAKVEEIYRRAKQFRVSTGRRPEPRPHNLREFSFRDIETPQGGAGHGPGEDSGAGLY